MFSKIIMYFYLKKAQKILTATFSYTEKILNEFGAKYDVGHQQEAFFCAWFNYIYATQVSNSEKLHLAEIALIKSTLTEIMSENDVDIFLKTHSRYFEEFHSKSRSSLGKPAFYCIMSDIAYQFLLEENPELDYDYTFNYLLSTAKSYINQFKK